MIRKINYLKARQHQTISSFKTWEGCWKTQTTMYYTSTRRTSLSVAPGLRLPAPPRGGVPLSADAPVPPSLRRVLRLRVRPVDAGAGHLVRGGQRAGAVRGQVQLLQLGGRRRCHVRREKFGCSDNWCDVVPSMKSRLKVTMCASSSSIHLPTVCIISLKVSFWVRQAFSSKIIPSRIYLNL